VDVGVADVDEKKEALLELKATGLWRQCHIVLSNTGHMYLAGAIFP
jgi:hypothetical protein